LRPNPGPWTFEATWSGERPPAVDLCRGRSRPEQVAPAGVEEVLVVERGPNRATTRTLSTSTCRTRPDAAPERAAQRGRPDNDETKTPERQRGEHGTSGSCRSAPRAQTPHRAPRGCGVGSAPRGGWSTGGDGGQRRKVLGRGSRCRRSAGHLIGSTSERTSSSTTALGPSFGPHSDPRALSSTAARAGRGASSWRAATEVR